jgi:hypothetical protein
MQVTDGLAMVECTSVYSGWDLSARLGTNSVGCVAATVDFGKAGKCWKAVTHRGYRGKAGDGRGAFFR